MDILRFATAGSVDDGKSTLIGRLLFDSKSIFTDQLEAVEATSAQRGDEYTDLALLTDGLRAEREQGITIDVAYRYFSTPKRKFIIADTPGHIQYTRNMVTGASTADLAIILVDARKGLQEQSRRHATLVSLLRVPHIVLAINKMDLVDWSEDVYREISEEFIDFAARLEFTDVTTIPLSALTGDNVVTRSERTDWYDGPSLLHHLENVYIASDRNLVDVRFPVQYVIGPRTARATTVPSPARSSAACCAPATTSSCCPAACRAGSRRSTPPRASWPRRTPPCRSRSASRTRSTCHAAT
jgi:bifunctional enzyme CysN/CysC